MVFALWGSEAKSLLMLIMYLHFSKNFIGCLLEMNPIWNNNSAVLPNNRAPRYLSSLLPLPSHKLCLNRDVVKLHVLNEFEVTLFFVLQHLICALCAVICPSKSGSH